MSKKNIYSIATLSFVLDQVIKLIIVQNMNLYQEIVVIPQFFSILYVKNTGAAFSILENNTFLLIIIGVLFMVGLNRYIKRENFYSKLSIISLGLILGGIYGNLLDRIIRGAVVDYLSFLIIHYEFPVFNLADICITVGIGLFILDSFINKRKEE